MQVIGDMDVIDGQDDGGRESEGSKGNLSDKQVYDDFAWKSLRVLAVLNMGMKGGCYPPHWFETSAIISYGNLIL